MLVVQLQAAQAGREVGAGLTLRANNGELRETLRTGQQLR